MWLAFSWIIQSALAGTPESQVIAADLTVHSDHGQTFVHVRMEAAADVVTLRATRIEGGALCGSTLAIDFDADGGELDLFDDAPACPSSTALTSEEATLAMMVLYTWTAPTTVLSEPNDRHCWQTMWDAEQKVCADSAVRTDETTFRIGPISARASSWTRAHGRLLPETVAVTGEKGIVVAVDIDYRTRTDVVPLREE